MCTSTKYERSMFLVIITPDVGDGRNERVRDGEGEEERERGREEPGREGDGGVRDGEGEGGAREGGRWSCLLMCLPVGELVAGSLIQHLLKAPNTVL